MTSLNLVDYWWVLHLALISTAIALFLLVRFIMDVLDYRRSRRMAAYCQRYGSADYWNMTSRPNIRRS